MTAPAAPARLDARTWRVRDRAFPLGSTPLLMGIVNVTPDSFSDGGDFLDTDSAIDHGLALADAGAAILDVGGESTRPGAEPVSAAQELARVLPVVEALARATGAAISIDTTKVEVARAALDAGASIVNDVSALRFAPELAELAADVGAGIVLMHMKGDPRTMQADPRYDDLFGEIGGELDAAATRARAAGVPREAIVLDPGLGFGKTAADSMRLLAGLHHLTALGYPLLVGHSRKSFLDPAKQRDARDRLPESLTAGLLAALGGAAILRVHDVSAHARMLAILERHREAIEDP